MTVIDDVIKAEQEAESAIAEARSAATKAVSEAKSKQQDSLSKKADELAAHAVEALQNHEAKAHEKAKSLTAETTAQTGAIEQRFQNQASDIASKIKQAFQ